MAPKLKTRKSVFKKDWYGSVVVLFVAVLMVIAYTMFLSNTLADSVVNSAVKEATSRTDAMYEVMDSLLSREDFDDINSPADMESSYYTELQAHLSEVRSLNSTRYFYTVKRAADGTLVYVVDGLDRNSSDFRKPGDAIEDEMVPYIEHALAGETVISQDIVDTDWGHILTACYPVHDTETGETIGALCVEVDMTSTYNYIQDRRRTLVLGAGAAILVICLMVACVYVLIRNFHQRERADEEKLEKSYEQIERALEGERKHTEIVTALATIYTTIFEVNLVTHEYEIVESVELMHGTVARTGDIRPVLGAILNAFMAPDMRDEMGEFLNVDTLAERMGANNTVMTEYKNPDGRWFQARFIAKRRDEAGTVTEVLYCARDFTDEKNRELALRDQLRDAAEEAKRANLSKTTFLRRMSHDIRTPLNGIIGMMRVQESCADDPAKQAETREKIMHSADYLLDLVNNVLDISKLESGALELENKPFHLGELLMKNTSVTEASAGEYGITFIGGREASHIEHYHVIGSETYLNRILMNLASNAVKYNRRGGYVKVWVDELGCDGETATYRFTCEDSGLGMSQEFLERAFEPFTQEGKETVTSFSGSGLGLSIVKDIVEMMGGTIEIKSEENVGTTITITLAFELDKSADTDAGEAASNALIDVTGRRALLVEDNELNMEIARFMLEGKGLVITEAKNGMEAVDAFVASPEGGFDYIFMDVMMPVMDGIEATKTIRSLERADAKTVRIIAMTANAFADDKRSCLEAGMNAHVGKPLEDAALNEALAAVE